MVVDVEMGRWKCPGKEKTTEVTALPVNREKR